MAAKLICSWYFCSWTRTNCGVVDHAKFFKALGQRIRDLRRRKRYSQEDMISFGFSARHWQQIEAGRPITVTTLLRVCDVLKIRIGQIVRGLDRGIYRN
jgi:DNA-binding Xre family transcriptional regulator